MQVARKITADQALADFIKLARATRMTGDEHEHFSLLAQVLKVEIDEGEAAKKELETLKVEHAKCASKSSDAHPPSGEMGSQGNGAQLGEGRSPVGASQPVQELIQ